MAFPPSATTVRSVVGAPPLQALMHYESMQRNFCFCTYRIMSFYHVRGVYLISYFDS